MRKLLALAGVICLALVVPSVVDAKRLPMGEAALQAQIVIGEFTLKTAALGYPDRVQCRRLAPRRVRCQTVMIGDLPRERLRCRLVADVVNREIRYNYFSLWEARARLTQKHCRKTAKPYITDAQARRLARTAANDVAGVPTTITEVFRLSDTRVIVYAEWNQAGQFGQETCSLQVTLTRPGGAIQVATGTPLCF